MTAAYDAGTADGGTIRTQDDGRAIASCAGRVVMIGDSAPMGSGNRDFIVRAFDADSGDLLWSDGIQSDTHDDARSVACDNERVLVTLASGFNDPVAILRAYNIEDGTLLWSVQYEDRFGNSPTDLKLDETPRDHDIGVRAYAYP